ncbi:MAG: YbaN family protein [Pseudomonadota bacterium]
MRFVALGLAYLFFALAIIGVVVPGLPTVPFLLLSAWFASRGSDRFHRWLHEHAYFGKLLKDWEQYGAISRNNKVVAVAMLVLSWLVLYWTVDIAWLPAAAAFFFTCVALFLISRPEKN